MVLPGALWIFLYNYVPMFGVVVAFKDFKFSRKGFLHALITSEWVGLDNFRFIFESKDALLITRNTLCYNLTFIVAGTIFAIALAIALSRMRNQKLAKIYQTGIFLPYFLSWVVAAYFLKIFLNPEFGFCNAILGKFGIGPIDWYMEPKYWPGLLVFMGLWKGTGYSAIVYLASITGIDKAYYEAAMIDGASEWQQIKHITIPSIVPVMIILVLLSVGRIFNADFGLFYQLPLNSGPLFEVTNVLDTYIFRAMRCMGDIGMPAAAGLYQSCVGFVFIMVSNWVVRRYDEQKALF